jgi:hypothetical protein
MPNIIARKDNTYNSQLTDLRGGVNNALADDNIADNELSDARNLLPDLQSSGEIIKRDGVSRHSAVFTETINGIFDGAAADYICAQTAIHDLEGTSVDGSLTSSTTWDHTIFDSDANGLIDIFVNGTNERRTSDASSFSNVANMPNATLVEAYNRFVFCAGHDRGHLRWSDPEDEETWNTENEIIFADESTFTGLKKYKQSIYMFFPNSFHQITGTGEKQMRITASNHEVGCSSPRSVVISPYGLFWWSNQGMIWSPDGRDAINITLPIIPRTFAALNASRFSNVHGVWQNLKGCVSMYVSENSSSTSEDMRIDYFPTELNPQRPPNSRAAQLGTMWIQTGSGVEAQASGIVRISGVDDMYVGENGSEGFVNKSGTAQDVSTNIMSYFETKRETAKLGEDIIKRFKYLDVLYILSGATTLTYGVYINDETGLSKQWNFTGSAKGFILDTDVLGTGRLGSGLGGPSSKRIGYFRRWKKVKHYVSDSTARQTRFRGIINAGKIVGG